MESDFRRVYISRVGTLNVVEKVQHIKAFEVLYNDIWARKTIICFVGSILPSIASNEGGVLDFFSE